MDLSNLSEEKKTKLQENKKNLGVSVETLLSKGNPDTIIEDFKRGKLTLLND